MRIRLEQPKYFFEQIAKNENMSLTKISSKLKLNYNTLKIYRRGELTIPKEIFLFLVDYSRNKKFWLENYEEVEDNWGKIKGGINSARQNDVKKRLQHARNFRKIVKVKIKLDREFCEFYGILLGDGCITRYKTSDGKLKTQICISCNKKLDSEYLINLGIL